MKDPFMARRRILTARQRAAIFDLPGSLPDVLIHHTLSEQDLVIVGRRRGDNNKLGFALQLAAFRYPGRLIQPGEKIPDVMLEHVAGQIGVCPDAAATYAVTGTTHYRHSGDLQRLLGYRPCSGQALADLKARLLAAAGSAQPGAELLEGCVDWLRKQRVILPAADPLERMVADAMLGAERSVADRLYARLSGSVRKRLEALLTDRADGRVAKYIWLRKFEPGHNGPGMARLLERLAVIEKIGVPGDLTGGLAPRQIDKLAREGARLYADNLRRLPGPRRLAILAASIIRWRRDMIDAVLETQERILGKIMREARQACDEAIAAEKAGISQTLGSVEKLLEALIDAHKSDADLGDAVETSLGWQGAEQLLADTQTLSGRIGHDPLDFIERGHTRIRRYAPGLLEALTFEGNGGAKRLLGQVGLLTAMYRDPARRLPKGASAAFAGAKWRKRLEPNDKGLDPKLWEIGVLFALKVRLATGDIWVSGAGRFGNPDRALPQVAEVKTMPDLGVPLEPSDWLSVQGCRLQSLLDRVSVAASDGALANARIEQGVLSLTRLDRDVPDGAADLILDVSRRLETVRITDLLLRVDAETGFADRFSELRNGSPPNDVRAILTVLIAEGMNLGLTRMARACPDYTFWELNRIATWHMRRETYDAALSVIMAAQAQLPMAQVWGGGKAASGDGQFFPSAGQGEALNLVNAKYGSRPGVKHYAHVADHFGPFHVKQIAATAYEAPHVLDGLVATRTGRKIEEAFTDTGGVNDYIFAVSHLLGFAFAPRIRNLPDRRFYVLGETVVPPALEGLVSGKIDQSVIIACWPEILRLIAAIKTGAILPSTLLQRLSAGPQRNTVAKALREVGKLVRTIFILGWLLDGDLQRRQQIGLNKGESHHALKDALWIGRQGEIRDRSFEHQDHRAAALNLLAAAVIYDNTRRIGEIVADMQADGLIANPELVRHLSPLPWGHIVITGEYRWN